MQYIGKLDKEKLGKFKDRVVSEDVIITEERVKHIQKRHPGDYEEYIEYIPEIIKDPDYIVEDNDNIDTVLFLKTIISNSERIQVVIKLQTNTVEESKSSSIITFWHIREKNYLKTIKSNELIYEKVDKNE